MPEAALTRPTRVLPASGDVDALSDVLHAIHLRGRDVSRSRTSAPLRHHEPDGVRAVYLVEQGRLRITAAGRSVRVDAGGLALVAQGGEHRLDADPDSAWVTGLFDVDEQAAEPVLRVLPAAVVIEPGERTQPWLDVARTLIVAEVTDPNPGGQVMVSRLLDLLFVRALRDWAAHGEDRASGLLTATLDPAIARALAAIHRAPGHPWSVEQLAAEAGQSRSAFADRFRRLVGASPGQYASRQRLAHAEHLLTTTDLAIGRIAAEAGYESEAAFSRAFSQQYAASPSSWRRRQA